VTATTLTPQVIDYLVAACAASTTLGAAQPVPVIIHDGPELTSDTLEEPRHLWIGGYPAALKSGEPGASGDQDFAFSGDQGATRDETIDIVCAADSWGGGISLKTFRDDCEAIVDAVSLMLRGSPRTGGPGDFSLGGLVMWAATTGPFEWYPRQTADGAGMLCTFKIQYRGRTTA
jgi:hypothetical protein